MMNTIKLSDQELELVNGGGWGEGFLLGVTPVGVLGVAVGFGVWLFNGYSDYKAGVSAGFDAAMA